MKRAPLVGALLILSLSSGPREHVLGQSPDQGEPVVRLQAEPSSLDLVRGERARVRVRGVDADGRHHEVDVRWAARREALSVSDGFVRGLTPGRHELVATAIHGGSGTPPSVRIPVTVRWPPVVDVQITSAPGRLYEGTTVSFTARAVHADGTERTDAAPRWRVSDQTVASVDAFGNVTGTTAGTVVISASIAGVEGAITVEVPEFPAVALEMSGTPTEAVRTGDVVRLTAVPTDRSGTAVTDLPIVWSVAYTASDDARGTAAPGQVVAGRFVADVAGSYGVVATSGPLTRTTRIEVVQREVVREVTVTGHGREDRIRTTAFWAFEGRDGRDYALTGSKRADGFAFVWDITDPSRIVKADSIQLDARTINDVKVSPEGRYATVTREGASDRRNGLVILDLSDPAHPTIASEVVERLTGGVHNAFPTDTHVFALSGGDKYVILDVTDIYAPRYVGEYDHPDSRLHDVWVHDGIAYSAEWSTGVVAVDVGNGRWAGTLEEPVLISVFPVPGGRTHAVFPYVQESTGTLYVFAADEIMDRRGLAYQGPGSGRGSYRDRFDPETGLGGVPLATRGYVQILNYDDPEEPEMVGRYEVGEYGTHNIWVEDDMLVQAYYEGGARIVDVSGELMGNLFTQGREIAVFKPFDQAGYVPNSPMVWDARPYKGHIFVSDTNSGLWAVKLEPEERPVT